MQLHVWEIIALGILAMWVVMQDMPAMKHTNHLNKALMTVEIYIILFTILYVLIYFVIFKLIMYHVLHIELENYELLSALSTAMLLFGLGFSIMLFPYDEHDE